MPTTTKTLFAAALASLLTVGLCASALADQPHRQYAPKPEGGYSSNPHVSQDHTKTYPNWTNRANLDPERVMSEKLQWTTNWKFMDPPFDDSLHGGHLAMDRGAELLAELNGSDNRFARCLGSRDGNLKGLRANHYPHFNQELGKVVNLEMMIEHCAARQGVTLQHGSYDNSAVSVYVASHSNGMPIRIDVTQGELKAAYDRGQERFHLRTGRMNMACGTCHVTLVGERLRGQALTTHYGDVAHWPTYRTKDELQSLHVRFTECNRNGGTQPLKPGSQPYVDIEVFLTALSNDYPVAVPSARD
ncbi:sulfur oxidation c-type cytochrome SoxA [Thioalkalivibrio denitrificans]|uniref:L-cysteine S-thiosulfotransferase subunit SoxA n=1 Tax=Thioalkalivibrio denitrificans TaxID=108003 RepID=A0A1V3N9S6_9GAMM|nr:sulfur oxidation c-type cytochrome SoxA [Thioalkalivibrio denitrificans]OOG21794.1 sulfur oxidation c-type cytochrome SoxA [Thioalkalivibrio denitrificans]